MHYDGILEFGQFTLEDLTPVNECRICGEPFTYVTNDRRELDIQCVNPDCSDGRCNAQMKLANF